MIISRHINTVKEGRLEEFVEFSKWWAQQFPPPGAFRLHLPTDRAPSNVIVQEEAFENRAEWERHAERVHNDPGFESAYARYRELLDDAKFELWEVIELK